jgi:hypothetical protein
MGKLSFFGNPEMPNPVDAKTASQLIRKNFHQIQSINIVIGSVDDLKDIAKSLLLNTNIMRLHFDFVPNISSYNAGDLVKILKIQEMISCMVEKNCIEKMPETAGFNFH